MFRGFEGTDEMIFPDKGVYCVVREGMIYNCTKKRVKLDVGNIASEIEFVPNGTSCRSGL